MALALAAMILFGLAGWFLWDSAKFAEPVGRNQAVKKMIEKACK